MGFVLFVLLTSYSRIVLITDIKEYHKIVIISSQMKQITKRTSSETLQGKFPKVKFQRKYLNKHISGSNRVEITRPVN